ncbi:MAG: hypothetical protein R3F56_00230 [Planctomycetota bacterium]
MKHRTLVLSVACATTCLSPAGAQRPVYSARLLGPAVTVNDMNEAGEAVGWTLTNGRVDAWIAGPEHPFATLPLLPGYNAAWAQGVNDAGVVVGSMTTGSLPEFGQACAWVPDGIGGYTIRLLGQLPGHTQSVAYVVNNRGDIAGVSLRPGFQGGPSVWFNSPGGVLDVSALGAPSSPHGLNDDRVMTGWSGGLFDLDTLQASPLPTLPSGWTGFQGWAINEHGELAGTAIHGGTRRSAAIWTRAGAWESISAEFSSSASVQAFDINRSGLTTAEVPAPAAHFAGINGSVALGSLLAPAEQGLWTFSVSLGNAVDDSGRIVAIGRDTRTQASGAILLTPGDCARSLGGRGPGNASATLCGSGLGFGESSEYVVVGAPAQTLGTLLISRAGFADVPAFGGTLVSFAGFLAQVAIATDGVGRFRVTIPGTPPPTTDLVLQTVLLDDRLPQRLAFTNAVLGEFGR